MKNFTLTMKEVEKQIEDIKKMKYDTEGVHVFEDDLHHDFILHIANNGTKEQREMAKRILTTDDIISERWYS